MIYCSMMASNHELSSPWNPQATTCTTKRGCLWVVRRTTSSMISPCRLVAFVYETPCIGMRKCRSSLSMSLLRCPSTMQTYTGTSGRARGFSSTLVREVSICAEATEEMLRNRTKARKRAVPTILSLPSWILANFYDDYTAGLCIRQLQEKQEDKWKDKPPKEILLWCK